MNRNDISFRTSKTRPKMVMDEKRKKNLKRLLINKVIRDLPMGFNSANVTILAEVEVDRALN